MKFIINIFVLLLTLINLNASAQETASTFDDRYKTVGTTLDDVINSILNNTATTSWVHNGQRFTTKSPPTTFPTSIRTYYTTTFPGITSTAKFPETENAESSERISVTTEMSSLGKEVTRPTSSVAAVFEHSDREDIEERESVTRTSLLTKYSDRPHLVYGKESSQICDFCLYEGEGNFTSYGYPLNYRNNLNCTYRVMRVDNSDTCEIELLFHDFDVPISSLPSTVFQSSRNNPKETDCREDYLEVSDRRYCGSGWRGLSEVIEFPANQRELIFRFVSNNIKSGRGFWTEVKRRPGSCYGVRLKPQASQICEERFSEIDFELKSPKFPDNYPMNSDCAYYVRRAHKDICGLEMTFNKFDVELSDGCIMDYLEIDGQKICGTLPENSKRIYQFEGDQKLIAFQSDSKHSRSGFNIHIRQITDCQTTMPLPAPPSCNVCTSEGFGTLVSYGYPDYYRNNLLCTYTIDRRNADYCHVEFLFEDFELEDSENCFADYLQLQGKRYCRDMLKSNKITVSFDQKEKNAVILFKTDSSTTKKGFLLQYKQIECSPNDLISDKSSSIPAISPDSYHQCDYVYTEREFIFQSEKFSNNYSNNLDCNYYIKRNTSKVCYVELTFRKFDVEASPECQYDFLEVGNTVRLCGTLQMETVRTYSFEGNEKVIKFHSDSSTNRGGYVIGVEQLECDGDKIIRRVPSSAAPIATAVTPSYQYPEESQCNQVYDLQELPITSPGYPNPYGPLIDCTYTIKKLYPNICKIDVLFYDFEIQPSDPSGHCKYDFLDFNGARICGEILKGTTKSYYFTSDVINIHFHADNSVTSSDRGFRIIVRQTECDPNQIVPNQIVPNQYVPNQIVPIEQSKKVPVQQPLLCHYIYRDYVFDVKSPNYPQNYPDNSNCKYTIIKKETNKICQLEVNFIDMNLQSDNGCQNDYINFNGQLMCGSLPGETTRYFPFTAPEFVINFVSNNDYITDRGFYLRLRQKECPPEDDSRQPSYGNGVSKCGGVYSDTSFELRSPQYPANYGTKHDCVYTIKRKNERICKIELRFIDFDIEPNAECEYDFLMIDNKRFCGDFPVNHMKTFQFYESEKNVMFHTVTSHNRRGFLIKGQQKECETSFSPIKEQSSEAIPLLPSLPSICELCFAEVMGTIQSYDYPNNYPPNLNCRYKITALPGQCMVQINFGAFNLEPASANGCESDYVEINHIRYCGRQLEGATRVLTFYGNPREVSIRFVSNAIITGRGFRASYNQMPCPEGVPINTLDSRSSTGIASSGTYPITVLDKTQTSRDSGFSRIPCDLVVYDMNFELITPKYPDHYPINSDCLFSIRRINPHICKLRLQFAHFDLNGKTKDCSGDHLEINGHRICGKLPNNTMKEYEFINYKMALRFKSDSSSSHYDNGFVIRGEQIDCVFEQQSRPSNIYASDRKQLPQEYKPLDQMNYQSAPGGFMLPTRDPPPQSSYDYPPPQPLPQPLPQPSMPPPQFDPYQDPPQPEPTKYPVSQIPMSMSQPISLLPTVPSRGDNQQLLNSQSKRNIIPALQYTRPIAQMRPVPYQSNPITYQKHGTGMSYTNNRMPPKSQPSSSSGYQNQPSNSYSYDRRSQRCDHNIDSMYFEIKGPTPGQSQCMYTVHKVKDSVCQLDIMFDTFEMGDPNCQREYMAINGERLCGTIPKDTLRSYRFDQPDIVMYMRSDLTHGKGFSLRARQVECPGMMGTPVNKQSVPFQTEGHQPFSHRPSPDRQHMPNFGVTTSVHGPQISVNAPPEGDHKISTHIHVGGPQRMGHLPETPELVMGSVGFGMQQFPVRRTDIPQSFGYGSAMISGGSRTNCNKEYSSMEFSIKSPNYPNQYGNNLNCRYTITQANPTVCAIDMRFESFDVEDDQKCAKDYLEVDSGRVCGMLPPAHERRYHFLPEEYEKHLIFKTDNSGSKSGFSIQIRQITDCTKPWKKADSVSPTVCDVCSHSARGHITSGNYPHKYSDFMRCSYRIQAVSPQHCRVRIFIRDIDIETSKMGECDRDALMIGGERLCGDEPKIRDMTLDFPQNDPREVQFNFQSDASGGGRGFFIEYMQEMCSHVQSPSPSSPIVPNESVSKFPSNSFTSPPLPSHFTHVTGSDRVNPSDDASGRSISIPPIYPQNYVSRAHIEEIVQTQVQVLDRRNNDTVKISNFGQ